MKRALGALALTALLLARPIRLHAAAALNSADVRSAFKSNLQTTLHRHLNLLLRADGSLAALKGKTAAMAMAAGMVSAYGRAFAPSSPRA